MTLGFDYQQILLAWDATKEQQKADFLDHMYNCASRHDPAHPMHGLYTGLWQDFCIEEAGPVCRNQYFEFRAAVDEYEASLKNN